MKEIEKKLWRKVDRWSFLFRLCPFLRMVAVCNNLSFGSVNEGSDIDIFVVSKNGRLFTSRIFITVFLHLFGLRRHGKKVVGRFCLSFFVDDSFMNLSSIAIDYDVYLAYWVRSLKPIVDDGVSVEFLYENLWAKKFFDDSEDFLIDSSRASVSGSFVSRGFERFLSSSFGDYVELKLKNWQLRRSREKMKLATAAASLLVEDHVLKFHNIDKRREYRNLWIDKYGRTAKLKRGRSLFT